MPALDYLFWRNPVLLWLSKRGWYDQSSPTVPFALKHLGQRLKTAPDEKDAKMSEGREDLLAKFLNAKRENPEIVNDRTILGLSLSMVNAGGDTTAITLSAFFYYLLKTPRCLDRLQEELDTHLSEKSSGSFKYIITFKEAQQLSYLEACIKETFRMHPSLSLFLERKVPPSGADICGHWIPGGTIVGCNAWAIHRNKVVFGDDIEVFRPERWLEDNDKVAWRNRSLFQFGSGSHTCLGKNISLLEMYKFIPSFLRTFKVCLSLLWRHFSVIRLWLIPLPLLDHA